MADDKDDRFFHIHRAKAEIGKRRFRICPWKTKRRNLCDIGNFHAYLVDHTCMEDLGFEINVIAFLAGMGDREQLGNLVLAVIEGRRGSVAGSRRQAG